MKVWILLPAFNEEQSIPLLFPKIKKAFDEWSQPYRIVVVEDGSLDSTVEVLNEMKSEYPLDIVKHRLNRGLGETERDGFEHVAQYAEDDDIVVRLDCDDTHEPEYILSMINKIKEGYDVVNTSRFQPGGGQKGVGTYRAIISYAANFFMKIVFGIPGVRDYSCGY
jgi:dolichol-phosphate mannosyltransferase